MENLYFKKVFRGYNPVEVEGFINGLSSEYEAKRKEYEKKISGMTEQEEILCAKISGLRDENKMLAARISELEAEKSADGEEKKETGDPLRELYANIGEKILMADRKAEEIIEKARSEAAEIKVTVGAECEKIKESIMKNAAERSEEINELINEFKSKQASISEGLEQVKNRVLGLLNGKKENL